MRHHQLFCVGVRLETLILTREHRLTVFEKIMLKRIFGSQRKEDTGGRKKPYIYELRNLYL
jgi:hypothetical protein